MKSLFTISVAACLLGLSVTSMAADKPAAKPKAAEAAKVQEETAPPAGQVGMSLRKTAEAIRDGTINVGKEHSLDPEKGRFHRVHASVLGLNDESILDIKCGGCHSTDEYPDSYLYLRKAEFPRVVDGIKVRAVQRHFCISCHSGGSVSTVFYNPKK